MIKRHILVISAVVILISGCSAAGNGEVRTTGDQSGYSAQKAKNQTTYNETIDETSEEARDEEVRDEIGGFLLEDIMPSDLIGYIDSEIANVTPETAADMVQSLISLQYRSIWLFENGSEDEERLDDNGLARGLDGSIRVDYGMLLARYSGYITDEMTEYISLLDMAEGASGFSGYPKRLTAYERYIGKYPALARANDIWGRFYQDLRAYLSYHDEETGSYGISVIEAYRTDLSEFEGYITHGLISEFLELLEISGGRYTDEIARFIDKVTVPGC